MLQRQRCEGDIYHLERRHAINTISSSMQSCLVTAIVWSGWETADLRAEGWMVETEFSADRIGQVAVWCILCILSQQKY